MSYFKKFTDACAAVAAAAASLFFIRKYMEFTPKVSDDPQNDPSKLEQFLEPSATADYSMLLPLIIILLISLIVGRIFKRLPYLCFIVSVLPFAHIVYMFKLDRLYEQEALFLVMGALHVVGNLAECLLRDREDGRHRMAIAARLFSGASALFCYYVIKLNQKGPPADTTDIKFNQFEIDVLYRLKEEEIAIITKLGWMFLVLFIVSIILYNVYFIDALLAIPPFVYCIYCVFSETLGRMSLLFFAITIICLVAHLLLTVFENNLSRKEQKKQQ